MPTATRFINRITEMDDFADDLTWAGQQTFSDKVMFSGILLLDNAQKVQFKDSGGIARDFLYFSSGDDGYVGDGIDYGKSLHLAPGGNAKVTVTGEGDVGIGTLAPAVDGLDITRAGATLQLWNTTDGAEANFYQIANNAGGNYKYFTLQVDPDAATNGQFNIIPNNNIPASAVLSIQSGGNIGVCTPDPGAKFHVNQASTTAAIPVLYLDQADVSEEMIEFNSTIGVGNAIEAVGTKALTTTHFLKVTLPGSLTRYIPCGTIA